MLRNEKPTANGPAADYARDRMVSRRRFLAGTLSLAGLAATTMMIPRLHAQEVKPPEDPMRVPGALPRPYGDRSPFVKSARVGGAGPGAPHGWGENTPNNFNSWTPLQHQRVDGRQAVDAAGGGRCATRRELDAGGGKRRRGHGPERSAD